MTLGAVLCACFLVTTPLRWKTKHRGPEEDEARRLEALKEENGPLKKIVENQVLDIDTLKAVLSKKSRRPTGEARGVYPRLEP